MFQSPIVFDTQKQPTLLSSSDILHIDRVRSIKRYKYDPEKKQWDVLNKVDLHSNGTHYRLTQFHFHQPGEHTINGQKFPLEMHLVFEKIADDSKTHQNISVIGLLAKRGDRTSSILRRIIKNEHFRIPPPKRYFAYPGSLTTPPLNVEVNWTVYKDRYLSITSKDAAKLLKRSKGERPLQPREGQVIVLVTPEMCEK